MKMKSLSYVFSHTDSSKDSTCCAVDSLPVSTQVSIGAQLGIGTITAQNDYTRLCNGYNSWDSKVSI